jgi:hypothetical protein
VAEAQSLTIRLARLRVPLGFVAAAVAIGLAAPTGTSLLVGTLIAASGEALRVWASGHLNKSREVTASGPYRYLAHPLYVGSSIIGLGMSIASARPAVALLVAVYLGLTITAAIKKEEAFLRKAYGDAYDRYRHAGVVNERRRFSLDQAMRNREYRALLGFAGVVLLLVAKAAYNASFWGAAGTRFNLPGG